MSTCCISQNPSVFLFELDIFRILPSIHAFVVDLNTLKSCHVLLPLLLTWTHFTLFHIFVSFVAKVNIFWIKFCSGDVFIDLNIFYNMQYFGAFVVEFDIFYIIWCFYIFYWWLDDFLDYLIFWCICCWLEHNLHFLKYWCLCCWLELVSHYVIF